MLAIAQFSAFSATYRYRVCCVLEAISASYGHFPIVGSHKHHIRADPAGVTAPKGEEAKEVPAADLQNFDAVQEHLLRLIVVFAHAKTGGYADLSANNIAAFRDH